MQKSKYLTVNKVSLKIKYDEDIDTKMQRFYYIEDVMHEGESIFDLLRQDVIDEIDERIQYE